MRPPDDLAGGMLSATGSEKQLISTVLEERHAAWLPALIRQLPDAAAFTDKDRGLVWTAVISLQASGQNVNLENLVATLRREHGQPDAETLVLSLVEGSMIWDEATALFHAQQIAFAHARRESAEAVRMIETTDAGPKELAAMLTEKLASIQRIAIATGADLPEPRPLLVALAQVKPFNLDWLPASLRPWIADIAELMQCPPDYPAVAAMTALSSVAGRRFCIQPKEMDEAFIEFPHLWGMLIGRPSLMKSPAMQAAMRPLRAMEREAFSQHESSVHELKAAEIEAKFKRKGLESKATKAAKVGDAFDYAALIETEGEECPCRRFIVNDASIEALGEVLRDNPTGTLLYQDELAGLLALLDKDHNQALRSFLLQAWSGKEGFTFDRIMRGTRRVEHCALSVLGSIQPGVIASHVRAANSNGEGADGFLQRFSLMVWPDVSKDWRDIDRPLDRQAEDEATSVFQTIEALTPAQLIQSGAHEGRDGVPTFRFAPDAQERFRAWRYAVEIRLRGDGMAPAFEGHLGKYRKLVPALAVLIHIAEWQTGAVSLSALERALSWADYLESHAARIYSAGTVAECEAARSLLRKLQDCSAGLPVEFTARLIRRKGWSGLDTPEKAEAACEVLVDHGWLIATQQASTERGGRPTYLYRLNPRAENLKGS